MTCYVDDVYFLIHGFLFLDPLPPAIRRDLPAYDPGRQSFRATQKNEELGYTRQARRSRARLARTPREERFEVCCLKHSRQYHLKLTLSRPFRILFTEPIVLAVSLYMSFIYGILYLMLTGYAEIFQGVYHMNPGVGGLVCYLHL